jgi:hypothetical protein
VAEKASSAKKTEDTVVSAYKIAIWSSGNAAVHVSSFWNRMSLIGGCPAASED